ncbi:MAG: hypothetical protein KJ558_05465 [Gammaproteobacteria bacterium]|nr:hypothetical protein [Gammaproteobacteria bacterium]MBU1654264.1 hypothetical protein [Gammaproteobacteria bacterium]MBU1960653.1 hypothetical protein [Gammaproteobacteria bacterium]
MAVLTILQDEKQKCDFRFSSFSNGLSPMKNGGSSLNPEVLAVLQEPPMNRYFPSSLCRTQRDKAGTEGGAGLALKRFRRFGHRVAHR